MLLRLMVIAASIAGTWCHGDWSYVGHLGPDHWDGECHTGDAQSPVNLVSKQTQPASFEPWSFSGYEQSGGASLRNNGHTVRLSLKTEFQPILSGGGLNGSYMFAQAHFHWGVHSKQGSEHHIDGRSFPLEMHLVHYNTKYEDINEALDKDDGLAAVAVMFRLSGIPNPALQPLVDIEKNLLEPHTSQDLRQNIRLSSLLPEDKSLFYRYQGSLTTPACNQVVTWTVFRNPLTVSETQLEEFRHLKAAHGEPMGDNFRPLQPLNGRPVLYNGTTRHLPSPKIEPPPDSATDQETQHSHNFVIEVEAEDISEVDHFFLISVGTLVLLLQSGYALLEAGAVRSKNAVNISIRYFLMLCLGFLFYWLVGFGISWGGDAGHFSGALYFLTIGMPDFHLSRFFFQFTFAASAVSLVSRSLSERCSSLVHGFYCILITGFIFPVLAHWTWHRQGWLAQGGFQDFAGSGAVHLSGAACALAGCLLLGPRLGRFDKSGHLLYISGHNMTLSGLGGLLLVFGLIAQNSAELGHISIQGDGIIIARSAVNTALSAAMAAIAVLVFNRCFSATCSLLTVINAALTGAVAACAGCNVLPLWATVVLGFLAGPVYLLSSLLLIRLHVDDPVNGIPVHGGGGLLGLLAAPLLRADGYGVMLSPSYDSLLHLGWNLVGAGVIVLWSGGLSALMFGLLKRFDILRLKPELEESGLDIVAHGIRAYPETLNLEKNKRKENGMEPESDPLYIQA